MATLHQARLHHHHLLPNQKPRLLHFKIPNSFSFSKKLFFSRNSFLFSNNGYNGLLRTSSSSFGKKHNGVLLYVVNDNGNRLCCFCKASGDEVEVDENETAIEDNESRPGFDINLAVVLAGFAFEAYTTPPENAGKHEVDASNCQAVFLSESFVREIYDGQLFIKLKKGFQFPAMDPWGTSDPYVVMELDSQVVKSKVKWGTKEPTWNEEFSLNIKQPPTKNLQVAAWDANLVTPHKRMGNAEIDLGSICDGNIHEVLVELAGMGGGGKIQLEIKYKSFGKIDEEKDRWRIPMVTDFLQKHGFESALKNMVGSESVQARQFVDFAFGQLKSLNDTYIQKNMFSNDTRERENPDGLNGESGTFSEPENNLENPPDDIIDTQNGNEQKEINTNLEKSLENSNIVNDIDNGDNSSLMPHVSEASDKDFWGKLAETVNQNVVQRFGLPVPEKIKLDGFELLNKIGLQSREIAEAVYVESGLATPKDWGDISNNEATGLQTPIVDQSSLADIKKVTQDLVKQTDAVLGSLMVLNATVSQFTKGAGLMGKDDNKENAKTNMGEDSNGKTITSPADAVELDEKKAEEMRVLFSKAESAMEAWAMLATSLGHSSFIKSEFEKICFLDNPSTDTQLALWRDSARKRLVVAFRGTEQTKWKDLLTDLMLVPAGLNPERIGGDFKQEVQVHSGFLSAYDSVRTRLITLIKQVVGFTDDGVEPLSKWHVYVTGHSLGGALATLLALELSSSQLAKHGAISVTMYNFGSPRVGNKKFAEIYNQKIKDSWRVVNHRDIIPTVPRLMGYFHVAQPVYLAAGNGANALENVDPMEDGYEGDVIGEATPDILVSEFMKGEKQLIEKILNTEINIFLAIRDGSALMQHMEDFYYVTLLEHVKSNYRTVPRPQQDEENSL